MCAEVNRNRSLLFDQLKGLLIISVVLFHLGLFKYGYLGVDVFLCIAGYFSACSIAHAEETLQFSAWAFLRRRFSRLFPMAVLGTTVALIFGYVAMIPDDLENLSESVIASNCFLNNILCRISSSDYWSPRNEFKPLLHYWYLGVLVQLYMIYAFVHAFCSKVLRRFGLSNLEIWIILCTAIASAVLWFGNVGSAPVRFYYVPWRWWEFCVGVCVYHFCGGVSTLQTIRVPGLSFIGKASFSIYIWHYIVLSTCKYALGVDIGCEFLMAYFVVLGILSWLTYRYVENIELHSATIARIWYGGIVCLFALSSLVALVIYLRAGIVRDIPELEVRSSDVRRGLHAQYNDRIKRYCNGFANNGLRKVLVIGNSFARDWANVLMESSYSNKIDLAYCRHSATDADDIGLLFDEAEVVFLAGVYRDRLPECLQEFCDGNIANGRGKTYYVGRKWFGYSNGAAYCRRFFDDYYQCVYRVPNEIAQANLNDAVLLGECFIDMLGAVANDGKIPVFSDEKMYISQDCVHLTRAGARLYSRILNIGKYLGFKK